MIKFGPWRNPSHDGPHSFVGRRLRQGKTRLRHRHVHQHQARAGGVERRPHERGEGAAPTDGEVRQPRMVIGGFGWVSSQCRPDEAEAAAALLLQSSCA